MHDFEQLGVFYLGRPYDLAEQKTAPQPLLYDAKDLTTHAVCVGMTGSGKTGLCLALLEEAAIDGIPAIAIDPKGDLGNLMLAFPELRPQDFRPWIDPDEAARQTVSPDEFAARTATQWREGLAEWQEDGERIRRYRDAVDMAIYTPGSTAGIPLSVLSSFQAPGAAVLNDAEALGDRINGAVSGILALLGIDGDPLQSREHILLATLLDRAWRAGRDLDLGALIRDIQQPPVERVGLVDLETFYPARQRFELAMQLNNLLAAPGFAAWMQGDSLDVQRLLYTAEGKPRLSIISLAHLSDSERMFFLTILLSEVLAWVRGQPGTSSLRAILYMDEVFGYFPPSANPPSKRPMLTLLKQARAFGLGVVLATQNPVDLDYKGLSNAGTWFLGRLQTERDKARVLEGLEGASVTAGRAFDRARMESTLAGLGKRVFLMNNVHEDAPVVFQTRWTLSYLRGPLTRDQIQNLMRDRKALAASSAESKPATSASATPAGGARPMLPPEIQECFVLSRAAGSTIVYQPAVLGQARIHLSQAKLGVDEWRNVTLLADAGDDSVPDWEVATAQENLEFETSPADGAGFAPLPAALSQAKTYKSLAASLATHLYRTEKLTLWKCAALDALSAPDESQAEFRIRISQFGRERRDQAVEELRQKYASRLAALEERKRKAQQRVETKKAGVAQQMMDTAIRFGATLLAALTSRKLTSVTNVSRTATSVRSAGKIAQKRGDVAQAEEDVASVDEKIDALNEQFEAETRQLQEQFAPDQLMLEEVSVQPRKTDIAVSGVSLAWRPSA